MGLFDFLFKPPSRDKFARILSEAMRRAGVPGPIRYNKKEFRLEVGKDELYHLINIYEEYCRAPRKDRPFHLQRYSRTLLRTGVPDRLEDALPNLVPRVRDRFFYHAFQLDLKVQGKKGFEIAHEPLAEHFAVELGYDLPDSIATLSTDKLQAWGVTLPEMIERCLPTLRSATRRKLKTVRYGLYVADWQDNYDACRILLKDFIRQHEVDGEPVIAIPNRDTLILTGSRDEAGLKALVATVRRALENPRRMMGPPIVLSEGSYVPLSPEPGAPAYAELKELCIELLGSNYSYQRDLLDTLHKKEGKDVFVASYGSIENKEKSQLRSVSTWTQGVPTYLPQTDAVALMPTDASGKPDKVAGLTLVEWPDLVQVAGEHLKPLDLYPRRFFVDTFPGKEQLAELKIRTLGA